MIIVSQGKPIGESSLHPFYRYHHSRTVRKVLSYELLFEFQVSEP